jgi:hypothetical protein
MILLARTGRGRSDILNFPETLDAKRKRLVYIVLNGPCIFCRHVLRTNLGPIDQGGNMSDAKERAALTSIFASAGLATAKFVAAFITGSLGLLSDALHALLDVGAPS